MNNDQELVRSLLQLLKEYTAKLEVLENKIENIGASYMKVSPPNKDAQQVFRDKIHEFDSYLGMLSPALDDILRRSSQWVEHGKVEDIAAMELRLRLAELEATKQKVRRTLLRVRCF